MPIRRPNDEEKQHLVSNGFKDPKAWLIDDDSGEFIPAPKYGLAAAGRTALTTALPALAGTAAYVLSAPIAGPIGAMVPAYGASTGVGKLQDMALQKFAPEFAQQTALESIASPYKSTAVSVAAGAPLSGGGFRGITQPKTLVQLGPKRLAQAAGLQTAFNAAGQTISGEEFDPVKLAIASLGGTVLASPSPGLRGVQRNIMQRLGMPTTAIDSAMPPIVGDPTVSAQPQSEINAIDRTRSLPLDQRPGVDREFLLRGTAEQIRQVPDELHQTVARLKDKGVTITDPMLTQIAEGLNVTAAKNIEANILRTEVPKMAKNAEEIEIQRGIRAAAAREQELAAGELAAVDDVTAQKAAAATKAQVDPLQAATRANEEQVAVRAERMKLIETERKQIGKEQDSIRAALKMILDENNNLRPGIGPEHQATVENLGRTLEYLNSRAAQLANDLAAVYPGQAARIEPTALLGEGSKPTRPMPEQAESSLPRQLPPALPPKQLTAGRVIQGQAIQLEPRQQLQAQLEEVHAGRRLTIFVPEGSEMPTLGARDFVMEFPGKGKFVFDEPLSAVNQERVKGLVESGQDGVLLGYTNDKTEAAANPEVAKTVVVENAAGQRVKEQVAAPGEIPVAVAAAAVPPGGKVKLESPSETIAARQMGLKKNIDTDPQEFHSGLPEKLVKDTAANISKLMRSLVKRGVNINRPIEPGIDRIARSSPDGARLVSQFNKFAVDANAEVNPMIDHVIQAMKGLTKADQELLARHDYAAQDAGRAQTPDGLPAHLVPVWKALDDMTKLSMEKRATGPYVKDFDKHGASIHRPAEPTPGFRYQFEKPEIQRIRSGNDSAAKDAVRERYITWNMEKLGVDRIAATKIVDQKYFHSPLTAADNPNIMYEALRYSQGVGIPPEFRGNIFDATLRGLRRQGMDMAFHKDIESIPEIGRQIGLTENGRGEKYPELVLNAEGQPVKPLQAGLSRDVGEILRSVAYTADPEGQLFEGFNRALSATIIGPITGLRNTAQLAGIYAEIINPSEAAYVAKAYSRMFSKEQQNKAIQAGMLRPSRNIAMAVSESANDVLNRYSDFVQKTTGAEAIETGQRSFLYDLAEQVTWNRLITGDKEFFKQHGPMDWEKLDPKEAVRYTAVNIAARQAGTYDFRGLPNALLPGSRSWFKPFFSLARWSVERSNHWTKNVWNPALKGDLRPLIKSALGTAANAALVNWFNELLTRRKPRELTYEEWFNLGKEKTPGTTRDTGYTILSKLSTAGNLGIIGDLAFANIQLFSGEMPRGFNNILAGSVANVTERLVQFGDALLDGKATIRDIGTLGFEIARDNVQALRAFSAREDKEGLREERLARRTGYLPRESRVNYQLRNPWSERSAYSDENMPLLTKMAEEDIRDGMATGRMPSMPSTAIRSQVGFSPEGAPLFGKASDGLPLPNYYNFIKNAQGEPAAVSALVRDFNDTQKRKVLYGRALVGGMSNTVNRIIRRADGQ